MQKENGELSKECNKIIDIFEASHDKLRHRANKVRPLIREGRNTEASSWIHIIDLLQQKIKRLNEIITAAKEIKSDTVNKRRNNWSSRLFRKEAILPKRTRSYTNLNRSSYKKRKLQTDQSQPHLNDEAHKQLLIDLQNTIKLSGKKLALFNASQLAEIDRITEGKDVSHLSTQEMMPPSPSPEGSLSPEL